MIIKGLFLVNKPNRITSHDVVDNLRKITGEHRIGHAGTLDPLASGLLIVAIGREFTKQLDKFRGLDKTYVARIKLGENSNTYDAEGKISSVSDFQPSLIEVKNVLKSFVGTQAQLPPAFSAKKIKGQKAYNLARQGKKVKLNPKEIMIYKLNFISYKYPCINFEVTVSSGTFIRSLAFDIGKKLSTGAYLAKLVRTDIGKYNFKEAKDVDKIKKLSDLESVRISG